MADQTPTSASTSTSPTATPQAASTPPAGVTPVSSAPQTPQTGAQALFAAGMSILGVVTALFPGIPITSALVNALPQLRVALPIVLTSVGALWAAVSHPPAFAKPASNATTSQPQDH